MEQYVGENSKTKYLSVVNKIYLFHIMYMLVANIFILICLSLLFIFGISHNINFIKYMSYILIAIFIFLFVLLIVFITAKAIIITKNKKKIDFYKSNKLINIKKLMINYDYKLWLTAPKDTYHPLSFNLTENKNIVSYKTGIYFTNNEEYKKIFKIKIPKVLIARTYINNYAIIGYDEANDEMIIIDFEKGNR